MKKLILILIAIFVIGTALFMVRGGSDVKNISDIHLPTNSNQQQSEKGVAVPTHLDIPAINVSANVEQVGTDAEGRMGVPKAWQDVGWYNKGYRPGHNGSAVLSGHFDTANGGPAVFYRLKDLKVGDDIIVTDAEGKKHKFDVVKTEFYAYNALPLETIFNTKGKEELNLITCDGVWNAATHNYSQRLVVYSED